jgi:hypothetical protein
MDPLARLRDTSIWFELWHCQGVTAKIFIGHIILISKEKTKQSSSPGCVAKCFLTATLFHGRLENSSSEFSKMSPPDTRSASKAHAQVAQAVLNPRDLEASCAISAGLGSKSGKAKPKREAYPLRRAL